MKASEAAGRALEGVLLPTGWKVSGEVVGVSLMTFDELEYPVEPAAASFLGLDHLLRKHVRLFAIVRDGRLVELRDIELVGNDD